MGILIYTGRPILTVGRTTPYTGILDCINGRWTSAQYFITAEDKDSKAITDRVLPVVFFICVLTLTCGSDKRRSMNVWFFPT